MIGIVLIAAAEDVRKYRIHNGWIGIGLSLGLLFRIWEAGWRGSLFWLAGAVVPVVLLFLLFTIHAVGAGDLKLFSVIGGFYGGSAVISIMLPVFAAGGLMSIIHLIRRRDLRSYLRYLKIYSFNTFLNRKWKPYEINRRDRSAVIPFSAAIAAGTIYWIIFQRGL
ncbi:A24 family peptidase [Anaerolentibacter hominis]|uniref:A24 family peptidase n=1 Tax=Anaerolentibacter hominis TaxID=3079009 RepID=UPI0031B89A2F